MGPACWPLYRRGFPCACLCVLGWSYTERSLTSQCRKIAAGYCCLGMEGVGFFCFAFHKMSVACGGSSLVVLSKLHLLSLAINMLRFLPLVSLISSWCRFLTFSTLSNISCLAPITTDLSIANKQQHQGHIFWFLSDHCFPG